MGKEVKRRSKDKEAIPRSLLSTTMLSNMKKLREKMGRVCSQMNQYVVNPCLVVCPACRKEIVLGHTGQWSDLVKHFKASTSSDHRELLKAWMEDTVYTGHLETYEAFMDHCSYVSEENHDQSTL